MARPTKLTPELVKVAEEYVLLAASDTKLLPTVEGLAIACDIHRDTLYDWAEHNKTFSDILENLKKHQANKLIQLGLQGRYNSTIAKMILSGKHGYVEKQQTDLTTNGKDLPMPILGTSSVPSDNSDSQAPKAK